AWRRLELKANSLKSASVEEDMWIIKNNQKEDSGTKLGDIIIPEETMIKQQSIHTSTANPISEAQGNVSGATEYDSDLWTVDLCEYSKRGQRCSKGDACPNFHITPRKHNSQNGKTPCKV